MKKIPVRAAKEIADCYAQRQVILVCWDGELTHVVTYGRTLEECDQAAIGGNKVKAALGWPDSLHAEPSRVKKMKKEIESLRNLVRYLHWKLEDASNNYNFHVDEELMKKALTESAKVTS